MKTGRPRLPTKLHILHGNPGKRPLPENEPEPETGIPDLPGHLSAEAVLEWHRICKELIALRILTRVDRAALAAYCQAWGRWVDAEDHLRLEPMIFKAPSGYPVISPWWSVSNKAVEQMRVFLLEFGLTPGSRTRIRGTAVDPNAEETNPAKKYFA